MSYRILFICTGNVCRSPMAAALFNARARRAGEDALFTAQSAGTWALEKGVVSAHAIAVMAERDIDISNHRGRTVTHELLADAAVVIVMERSHLEALSAEFPAFRKKLHLMSELRQRTYDINDPYGGTFLEYEYCAQELETLIESGYEKIKSWISDTRQARIS